MFVADFDHFDHVQQVMEFDFNNIVVEYKTKKAIMISTFGFVVY